MQSQLLYNQWFGKAVGASCVWIWAPADPLWVSIWVIAGIALGHLYDTWAHHYALTHAVGGVVPKVLTQTQTTPSPHLRFLFAGMGLIAKSGGTVLPSHIDYTEKVIQQLGLTDRFRQQAINWFNEGKTGTSPFRELARSCFLGADALIARQFNLLRFCELTAKRANDESLASLNQLGQMLGFTAGRIAQHLGDVMPRRQRQRSTPKQSLRPDPSPELVAAYRCLDVAVGSDAKTAKQAYRRLVNRYHPDKLAKNATLAEQRNAETRMVEFREALEIIEANV